MQILKNSENRVYPSVLSGSRNHQEANRKGGICEALSDQEYIVVVFFPS